MTPEELEANLKDSLEHYLECATEPDFLEVGPGSFTCPDLTGLITLQVVSKAASGGVKSQFFGKINSKDC